MKFDPFKWQEVTDAKENQAPQGRLQIVSSGQAALFITSQGYEVCAGFASSHDITLAEPMTFRLETENPNIRSFLYNPDIRVHKPETEVFTNVDRKPMESGTVAAVRQAMRELAIQQREQLREMRQEAARLRPKPNAQIVPEPEPEPEIIPTQE